ncbi:hypothetical protein BJ6T_37300 [Bradyrhizobium japonicum USDA 6]|nr:hypothetical protein CF64_00805 [Bradyrhizobium japonicum]BAL09004.1 hypothetical protein BJ6T_37300 [Bradyrhizobium japonicum USDA 6]
MKQEWGRHQVETNEKRNTALGCQIDKPPCLVHTKGQWLLDQGRNAAAQQELGGLGVIASRSRDNGGARTQSQCHIQAVDHRESITRSRKIGQECL